MNSTRSKANPFGQSPHYWTAYFTLPQAALAAAEDAFGDMALAVSSFEADDQGTLWNIELLFGEPPDMAEIGRRLMVLAALHHIPVPELKSGRIEPKDWLAEVAQSFPPISIGRFYVHGSHAADGIPAGSLPIRVDAGAAFGSGEHGTTRCCLEALDWLGRQRHFRNILDMGCGSGILAIAAAKLWKTRVLAADIDPVAVRVTQDNARLNREQARVNAVVSDGYAGERIRREGPFDLIVSNILARPLIQFAPDLERHLARYGVAVLSGLLQSQEAQVLSAHLTQGLTLQKRFAHGQWRTLLLKRN